MSTHIRESLKSGIIGGIMGALISACIVSFIIPFPDTAIGNATNNGVSGFMGLLMYFKSHS
jgi:uncharacterized membrane protein YkgB